MQAVEDEKMEQDDALTATNPLLAEIEAETASEIDPKNKPRRYWTPKEEETFFEIWGRDNWRLTRHGKNTLFFAEWSKEMKERFDVDVKQEEIQAKVNQTRAKFRQVKKQLSLDSNAVRWKKYDIIERILKNQFRPKDAEPIPQEALARNRDISAEETMVMLNTTSPSRQPTPTSITSNSTQDAVVNVQDGGGGAPVESISDITNTPEAVAVFNSTGNDSHATNYNTELFSDHDEVKRDFDAAIDIKEEEFPEDYSNFQYQQRDQQNHYGSGGETVAVAAGAAGANATQQSAAAAAVTQQQQEETPQLHQLQTPQQQLLAQTIQQQLAAPQLPPTAPLPIHPELSLTQHIQQLQQQQVIVGTATTGNYDHSTATTNSYANQNSSASPLLNNQNQNHYATPIQNSATSVSAAPVYNTNTHGSQFSTAGNAHTPGGTSSMPPPPRSTMHAGAAGGTSTVSQVRKRRTSSISNNNIANNVLIPAGAVHLPAESLESMYLEEVRRKNQILDEQKDISRKRLHLEERKLTLMEQFFPKCLELQEQILQKLNST